ncbi:hypothetical protein D3C71_1935020 [compost metagenome]
MPLLELQQVADQRVLRGAVQVTVSGVQGVGFIHKRGECIGVIAPALAQHVGDQGIADDAFGEWMTVGGFFPLCAEVPVVGDVVVIEDHQARQVRKHPRHAAQPFLEGIDPHLL